MVIGWPEREDDGQTPGSSAWERVEQVELHPLLPCLLVPQPAHAVLAANLAEAMLPSCFGELPREIKQAILMHDAGWAPLDAGQIQRLRSASADGALPVSFLAHSPQEVSQTWTASIRSAEGISPLGGLIVGRHFSLLAGSMGKAHAEFLAAEEARQRKLEGSVAASQADLERWTAALGFCDLLSLYLITGVKSEVSLPVAHPASPQADTASRVRLQLEGNRLRWIPRIFPAGFRAELDALKHPLQARGSRSEKLTWETI